MESTTTSRKMVAACGGVPGPLGTSAMTSTEPQLPQPGDVIAGKYRLVRVIGEGGMGIVYEASHLRLRQRLAIKMVRPRLAARYHVVVRFEREARAAAQLKGPHLAKVIDVDATSDGLPYMVMEFLEGHDLARELASRGPIPVNEAVGWMLETCVAIAEAHELGIITDDQAPGNRVPRGRQEVGDCASARVGFLAARVAHGDDEASHGPRSL